jgi:hypothetical protein
MIILRVAMGTAWNRDTLSELTSSPMSFATMSARANRAAEASTGMTPQRNTDSADYDYDARSPDNRNTPVTLNEVVVNHPGINDTSSAKSHVL